MEIVYRGFVTVARAVFAVMGWRVRAVGVEHVPTRGPVILAPNHVSYLDPVAVALPVVLRRRRWPRFLAKRELFDRPWFARLLRSMRHVPVDRAVPGRGRTVLAEARRALDAGEVVVVFPEGTASQTFWPGRGKTGAARLAVDTGVPLIPVVVWGTQRLYPKGRPPEHRRGVVITVRYGTPLAVDHVPDGAGAEGGRGPAAGRDGSHVRTAVAAAHDALMTRLRDLVEDAARTYPQRPEVPADAWWVPRRLGGGAPPDAGDDVGDAPSDAGAVSGGPGGVAGRAPARDGTATGAETGARNATSPPTPGRGGDGRGSVGR